METHEFDGVPVGHFGRTPIPTEVPKRRVIDCVVAVLHSFRKLKQSIDAIRMAIVFSKFERVVEERSHSEPVRRLGIHDRLPESLTTAEQILGHVVSQILPADA
jgi:hypothetical protein